MVRPSLVELWDTYTQIMGFFFTLAIAAYCFRLSGFFKGGVFYRFFRLLGPAFAIYAFGALTDILPLMGWAPEWTHSIHFFSFAAFFTLITWSISLFYRAWKQMGMGEI